MFYTNPQVALEIPRMTSFLQTAPGTPALRYHSGAASEMMAIISSKRAAC